ncbi:MAG: hypothetical protein ACD_60C00125G0012 [uncultured bacterium]|nr:MAG: hypothetical protein ACD_60C00125G0012 [uncultured bacterium]
MSILTHATSTALWHSIIHDAERSCAIALKEDIESYLVFLLMRYTNRPELVKHIIAVDFLESMQLSKTKQEVALQEVGDMCLLFTGLYPKIAEKRLVKLNYFVKVGQAAYVKISKKSDDLYYSLSQQFVCLMDVLQSIRSYSKQYPDLLPLEAYEQWNDTGSQRALSVLKQYTQSPGAIPVLIDIKTSHE